MKKIVLSPDPEPECFRFLFSTGSLLFELAPRPAREKKIFYLTVKAVVPAPHFFDRVP